MAWIFYLHHPGYGPQYGERFESEDFAKALNKKFNQGFVYALRRGIDALGKNIVPVLGYGDGKRRVLIWRSRGPLEIHAYPFPPDRLPETPEGLSACALQINEHEETNES